MDIFCVIPKQQKQEHLKKKLFSAALIQIQKLEYQTMECIHLVCRPIWLQQLSPLSSPLHTLEKEWI